MECGCSELSARWRQRVSGNESFSLSLLSWLSTSDGDIREGGKQSKADTPPLWDSKSPRWYLLHVIQNKSWDSTGNSSGETNTKLHENVLPISVPLIRNSISTDSISLKCFVQYKKCFRVKQTNQKSETFSRNSLRRWSLIYRWQSSGFKPPRHEFIMRPHDFCTQRNTRREVEDKERRGEEKWWQREEITAQILFITIIHTSHGDV